MYFFDIEKVVGNNWKLMTYRDGSLAQWEGYGKYWKSATYYFDPKNLDTF